MGQHFDRARLLYRTDRYQAAVGELQKELAQSPNCPWSHALLSNCLSMLGDHDAAKRAAATAIEHGPDHDFTHAALAWAHYRVHERDAARRALDEALRLEPHDPNHHYLFALVELPRDRAAALAATERALALDPKHLVSLRTRARALHADGRHDSARATAAQGLSQAPNNADLHLTLGWALLAERQFAEAQERFAESLRLNPQSESARCGMIRARRDQFVWYRVGRRARDWLANWLFPRLTKDQLSAQRNLLLLLVGHACVTLMDAVWVPGVAVSDLLTRPWRGQPPELWRRARRGARVAAVGIVALALAAVCGWYCANPVAKVAAGMVATLAIVSTAVAAIDDRIMRWMYGVGLAIAAAGGLTVPAIYLGKVAWGLEPVRPPIHEQVIWFFAFGLTVFGRSLIELRDEAEY